MPRLIMVPTTLQTLPVELICYIFGNLEMADLLTCSTVGTIDCLLSVCMVNL